MCPRRCSCGDHRAARLGRLPRHRHRPERTVRLMPRYDYPYEQVRYRRRSSPGRALAGLMLLLGVTLEAIAALLRSTGGDGSGLVVTGLILACFGLLGLRATRSASA